MQQAYNEVGFIPQTRKYNGICTRADLTRHLNVARDFIYIYIYNFYLKFGVKIQNADVTIHYLYMYLVKLFCTLLSH